jgi:predicted AAA+ superfamily ATPase
MIFAQSGGIFEATSFAVPCEVSRTTISNYLSVLEATNIVHVIRPFSSRKTTEIVSAPKVYAFDTGFICHFKGWDTLRPNDLGYMWEHFVLNEMLGALQLSRINYWRDKRHHEVDFVIKQKREDLTAIECKWSADKFNIEGLRAFRHHYKHGQNFVVAHDVKRTYQRSVNNIKITFVSLNDLITHLKL